jgi:hypothetical protein
VKYNDEGKMELEDPVEIKCRWEEKVNMKQVPEGIKTVASGTVYVDRDMKEGGLLKLCALEDLIEADPRDETDARAVLAFTKTPNLKATEFFADCIHLGEKHERKHCHHSKRRG